MLTLRHNTVLLSFLGLVLTSHAAGASSISGVVKDSSGTPVAAARVFMEQGLGAGLVETRTDRRGNFHFEDVRPTLTSVFAYSSGHAFGGTTFSIAIAQDVTGIEIVLPAPARISGTISSFEGDPLEGARITRFGIRASRMSVPLAKLAAFGFVSVTSATSGRFTLEHVPADTLVNLKVIHSGFAQEGVNELPSDTRDAKIIMSRGTLLTGSVVTRGAETPVANANIIVSKSAPPADTVVTKTRYDGTFSVRLKPGVYLCKALGATYRSAAGQEIVITGEIPTQNALFRVAGLGMIKGKVRDALTGDAVASAQVDLHVQGVHSDTARTGTTGEFQIPAVAGESTLHFAHAPGYAIPPGGNVSFVMTEGGLFEHTYWVARNPVYHLTVVDEDDLPVAGAIISLLRPNEFKWRVANAQGKLSLNIESLPPDGNVVGMAYHPAREEAALFSIERTQAADAHVQLYPTTSVRGALEDHRGKSLEGALVAAKLAEGGPPEGLTLWYTTTDRRGKFAWNSVVPHVPLICTAVALDEDEIVREVQSSPFIIADDLPHDIGSLALEDGESTRSTTDRSLKWRDFPVLCGTVEESPRNAPTLLLYATPEEVPVYLENVAALHSFFEEHLINVVIASTGTVACADSDVPILKATAPGLPTTYLLDAKQKVVLETLGLPPIDALIRLSQGTKP